MAFTAQDVKTLRERTGAGFMDCKRALTETGGDSEKAVMWLREKGIADAARRVDRVANEGAIASYIHLGAKIGVLVEINCETDFVARCDDFKDFCKDTCLQICSAAPRWVKREDVSQEAVDGERAIYEAQAKGMGKPDHILDRIAQGKLEKWFQAVCLLEQQFVKDPDRSVEEVMKELAGRLGEKIEIRRFARFQLGEDIEQQAPNQQEEPAQEAAGSKRN